MSIVAGVDFGTLSGADVPMALAALSRPLPPQRPPVLTLLILLSVSASLR